MAGDEHRRARPGLQLLSVEQTGTIWWSDPDDDGDGVDDEVHFAILDVELALSGFVESAQDGVGRRSKTDSKKALDGFIDATTKALQQGSRLESCPSDVCRTVRENMDKRQRARQGRCWRCGRGELG